MNRSIFTSLLIILWSVLAMSVCGYAAETIATVRSEADPIRVVEVTSGLEVPWSLAFLPDGRMLVTERPGRLRIVSPDGHLSAPLAGVPKVHAEGQGGLLDVVLGPDFVNDGLIYFSYAEPVLRGARTAVARARLDANSLHLQEVTRIFAQNFAPSGNAIPQWQGSLFVGALRGSLLARLELSGNKVLREERLLTVIDHRIRDVRQGPDGKLYLLDETAGRILRLERP